MQTSQRLSMFIVFLTLAFSAQASYTLTDEDVEMDANGYIISCSYSFLDKDIIIPETLDGVTVKGIGDNYNDLFYDKDITSIQFPSGIEYIGRYAFRGNELTSIDIPIGITSLEERVFSANKFVSITIPNNIISIGREAFSYNPLTSVTIPNSVDYIGYGAFRSNKLTSITISEGVISIGELAFNNNQLTSVDIPNSVSSIGEEAFGSNELTGLTDFVLPTLAVTGFVDWIDGSGNHYAGGATVTDLSTNYRAQFPYTLTDADVVMDVNGYIISCSYSFAASMITIPETLGGYAVKGIGDNYRDLFEEKAITSIQLPSGLEYIGTNAFSNNILTSLTIPNTVTLIGEEAFSNNLLANITIPNSVTSVGTSAFTSNQLTAVTFSANVDSIGDMVFAYNQLTSITIPNNVTSIGGGAFSNNQLSSVIIPNSVNYIGDGAFRFNLLTSFILPTPTLTGFIDWVDINGDHYEAGTTVTDLSTYYRALIPYILKDEDVEVDNEGYIISCSYSFTETDIMIPETLDEYIIKGIVDGTWNTGPFLKKGITSIQLPSGLEYIGAYAFRENFLRSITIPNNVTTIEEGAFGNNQLASVTISNSVTSIGSGAFGANQLTSITIPNSVTFIGSSAFTGNLLTSVVIPNSVSSIEDWVFYRNQLTEVTIPNSVISIGVQAFGTNKLASVDLPNSVSYIQANAFYGNELTSFLLPTPTLTGFINWVDGFGNHYDGGASVTTELTTHYRARSPYTLTDEDVEMNDDGYIASCSYNFESSMITIPETLDGYTVKGIVNGSGNSGVFYEKAMLSIQLPSGIENIGGYAFGFNLLTSIDIPNNVTYIGNAAFSRNQLTSLIIPDSVRSIGYSAFSSNQLTSLVIPESAINFGSNAFSSNQLTSVNIPNSITYISAAMFSNNKLTSITIPNSVVYIGERAFVTNLFTSFVLPTPTEPGFVYWHESKSDLEYEGGDTVTDFGGSYTAKFGHILTDEDVEVDANGYIISCSYNFAENLIVIPDTLDGYKVKGIADGTVDTGVFYNKSMISIKLPVGIEIIGDYAFNSSSLYSVTIPNSVISIGEYAFALNYLTSFVLPTPPLTGFVGWVDGNGVHYEGGVTVTDLSTNYYARFAYILQDEDVEMDANGHIITCSYSFDIKDIMIPDSLDGYKVKGIADGTEDSGVFYNKAMTSVILPLGLEYIGTYAFSNNLLTSVTIPNSVTLIEEEAFSNNLLTGFVLPTLTVSGFVDWLDGSGNHYAGEATATDLSTIYRARFPYTLTDVDVEMDVNGYIISCSYGFGASMITIPETLDVYAVKGIGDDYSNLFYEKAITSIQLPSGLEYIGTYAFSYNLLTSVTIPNSVTSIGEEAFSNNLLTGFVLPEAQKEGYTFSNWNGSIPANTEVTDLLIAYTANFTLNTGIENVVGFNVMVYPSPTKAFVTIEADDIYSVELMSLCGVLVQKLNVTGTHCTIDLSSQSSGIYILRIEGKYGTCVKRFVKE